MKHREANSHISYLWWINDSKHSAPNDCFHYWLIMWSMKCQNIVHVNIQDQKIFDFGWFVLFYFSFLTVAVLDFTCLLFFIFLSCLLLCTKAQRQIPSMCNEPDSDSGSDCETAYRCLTAWAKSIFLLQAVRLLNSSSILQHKKTFFYCVA